jgi:hypothetical protein
MFPNKVNFVPPELLESGGLGALTSNDGESFNKETVDDVIRIVIEKFVDQLPEWQRSAVQMSVMSKFTYEETAEMISNLRGVQTDKKTVWRWAQQGVQSIKEWLAESPWVGAITHNKIPVAYIDFSTPVFLEEEED